ncbi:MAG: nucleotide sugar dehydrogenase [Candidatus Diapherotrites archaeon]|nr:nucleotide sugar dehydrogenase [Candidatus Diapherotrites archaeon]
MKTKTVCVAGLGYVGLPIALEFARHFKCIGFDTSRKRIEELSAGNDRNNETPSAELKKTKAQFTADENRIREADLVIVTVPTPVTEDNLPDLSFVEGASRTVGRNLKKGAIVVFESTVYPGATEEVCAPILEKESGLKCGRDFKIGYSPERINPGDKEHSLSKVKKVVSGMDNESAEEIAQCYSKIIGAGVFRAKNIKTAEAAKVIENIQRDLNIALVNELSLVFEKMGIDTEEVLEAAGTKWNFLRFRPGLVGGHCIPVDPYYLTWKAEQLGYTPNVILAGRETNNSMPLHAAGLLFSALAEAGKKPENARILVLGLTFKENVKDPRNSGAEKILKALKGRVKETIAFDPLLENEEVEKEFGVKNTAPEKIAGKVDAIIIAAAHDKIRAIGLHGLKALCNERPCLVDPKWVFSRAEAEKAGFIYKRF